MLGTNKEWTIQTIYNDRYINSITNLKFRSSPKTANSRGYIMKAMHITSNFRSDTADIIVGDRLVFWEKSYVFVWVGEFSDFMWPHLECIIRWIWTRFHDSVLLQDFEDTQENYDDLLWEWDGSKNTTDSLIKVLMDPAELLKSASIRIIDAGKLEDVDYVMTIELDQDIKNQDKIVYQDIDYDIKWIIPHPYQKLVWLSKWKTNYE